MEPAREFVTALEALAFEEAFSASYRESPLGKYLRGYIFAGGPWRHQKASKEGAAESFSRSIWQREKLS